MKTYKFDNDLTLITHFMPNQVVTIDCWVGTGSSEEKPEEFGMAHFLEHMMFKGTARFAVNELDNVMTGLGGQWNAGTSQDFTHYHGTVPAMHFETAADIVADMIRNAALDATEFDKERFVILEEIRRKHDSPTASMYEMLYERIFENGPYKHPVLGSMETVGAMTRDMMADFYRRFYTPDNAVVIIAGDVPEETAVEAARKYFGDWQGKRPKKQVPATDYTVAAAPCVMKMDVTENYQTLAWPAPPANQMREMLALDIASDVLTGGRSTRLPRRVKEELGLVGAVSCGMPSHAFPSLFYLFTSHTPENTEPSRDKALEVLRRFAEEGPTVEEMTRSRRKLRNDLFYSMEETEDVTAMVGYWYTLTGSTELVENYPRLLENISAEDVRHAVAKFLNHEPAIVSVQTK